MELLKVGTAPEYLRTALLLWNEFPSKLPSDIREAILSSHSLEDARAYLWGVHPKVESIPDVPRRPRRRRQRERIAIPSIEEEVTREQAVAEIVSVHVSPSWLQASIKHRKLKTQLKRQGWIRVRRHSRGPHERFQKGERHLSLPTTHGSINAGTLERYSLARLLSEARFSRQEVDELVRGM